MPARIWNNRWQQRARMHGEQKLVRREADLQEYVAFSMLTAAPTWTHPHMLVLESNRLCRIIMDQSSTQTLMPPFLDEPSSIDSTDCLPACRRLIIKSCQAYLAVLSVTRSWLLSMLVGRTKYLWWRTHTLREVVRARWEISCFCGCLIGQCVAYFVEKVSYCVVTATKGTRAVPPLLKLGETTQIEALADFELDSGAILQCFVFWIRLDRFYAFLHVICKCLFVAFFRVHFENIAQHYVKCLCAGTTCNIGRIYWKYRVLLLILFR